MISLMNIKPIGFNTADECWDYKAFICANYYVEELYICTYNMHTAIDNWRYPGLPTKMNPNQILCNKVHELGPYKSGIIIGEKTAIFRREWPHIKNKWPNAQFVYRPNTHSKISIIKFRDNNKLRCQIFCGSGNFNTSGRNSDWRDCITRQVSKEQRKFVCDHFNYLWSEAEIII